MPEQVFGIEAWKLLGWAAGVIATLFNVGVAYGAWQLRRQVQSKVQERFQDETAGTFVRLEDRIRKIEKMRADLEVLKGRMQATEKWVRLLMEEVVRKGGLGLRRPTEEERDDDPAG